MSKKNRDIEYYMNLDYDLVVRKISSEDGAFYQVTTKELSPAAFYGMGDTIEEAIHSFEETKKALFKDHLERGIEIPEPEKEEDLYYSGKFVVRTTPALHRKIVSLAKKEHRSLNSYINVLFEKINTMEDALDIFKQTMQSVIFSYAGRGVQDVYQYGDGRYFKTVEQKRADAA